MAWKWRVGILVLLLAAVGLLTVRADNTIVETIIKGITGGNSPVVDIDQKRPGDKREYQSLTLSNQLDVLIISDPDLNKSSAAMDVSVGSLADPDEHPGLAHFLEHMLFLGTDKYPDVDEYNRYLHSFQGSSNAYTAAENTNYHFEVNHDGFEGALDRFAQFFIAPTFDPAYVERERNAVHSEHQKNIKDDNWRVRMVLRNLYKEGHPGRKFSTGTRETLASVSQQVLRDFYGTHYSANRMKLAIMTVKPAEEAEKLIRATFAKIPDHGSPPLSYDSEVFTADQLPRKISVKPVKDLKTMSLLFDAPSDYEYWASKPETLISHLIGHEGKGSLLSLLKEKNLATGLSARVESSSYDSVFHFDISLTEKGMANPDEILVDFFRYVSLLKREGLKPYIYDEQKMMADINYVYRDHREGAYTAASYASMMHRYPAEEVDKRSRLFLSYSPEDYNRFLSCIRPDRLNVLIQGRDLPTDQTEEYYAAAYRVESLPDSLRARLEEPGTDPALSLPDPNPFIPQKLELLTQKEASQPEKLIDDERGVFWFQADDQFFLPKANIHILLLSQLVNRSPLDKLHALLYVMALNESLNEWNYELSLAGLHLSLSATDRGMQLDLSGYSERMPALIHEGLRKLKAVTISAERFEALKTELKDGIDNARLDVAYQQAMYELKFLSSKTLIHRDSLFNPEKGVDLISAVTLEDIRRFADELYSSFAMEGSAYGNLKKDELKASLADIFTVLKPDILPAADRPAVETIMFRPGQPMARVLNSRSPNHCWAMFLQMGRRNPAVNAAIRIGNAYLKTSFFNELRTQQQLGYIVFSGLNYHEKGLGMLFLIQSSDYSPFEIEKRVEAWKTSVMAELKALPEEQLHLFRQAVASELREPDKTMHEKHQMNIFEALILGGQFHYREKIAREAEHMTKDQVVELFSSAFDPQSEASMTVYMTAKDSTGPVASSARGFVIKDIGIYRESAAIY